MLVHSVQFCIGMISMACNQSVQLKNLKLQNTVVHFLYHEVMTDEGREGKKTINSATFLVSWDLL